MRLRRQSVRRVPGQRAGRAVRGLRLLVRPDDGRGETRDRLRARTDLSQGVAPARRDADRVGEHPAHHGTAHPGHLPRQPRARLPHPRHRDAHLRNRFVQRAFRVGCVGRRACPHHGARAVRRGRPGLRPAQLHDRGVRVRRPGRHPCRLDPGRCGRAATASGRPAARGARADLPAAAPPGRAAAAAGGVQAAPVRQRLRRAAQDGGQAVHRDPHLRADERRDRRDGRPQPARADARGGGVVHPGLRRDGRPVLAHPHRIALGPLPRPGRPARPRRQSMGLSPQPAQGRRRPDGVPQAAGGTVFRAGSGAGRAAAGRPDRAPGAAAAADRRPGPGQRCLPHRFPRNGFRAAVAAHRRGAGTRRAECGRAGALPG